MDYTSISQFEAYYKENFSKLISNIITITEIPSPSFDEDEKGDFVKSYFSSKTELTVTKDKYKNVIIRYRGKQNIAKLAILAHIDTVFPKKTKLKVQEKKDEHNEPVLIGPSVGDNSASVAGLMQIIDSWCEINFIPPFDVIFVANACEEGLGDLKGVKGFIDEYCANNNVDLKVLLSLDGTMDRVTHIGTGVKRYKIDVNTKGGHSWGNFGEYSAIHIIGQIIADISHISVPETPKTTYNVGIVEGGTSVNTIASEASILIDLRSVSDKELEKLDKNILNIVNEHTSHKHQVNVSITVVGNRPSGRIPHDHELVEIVKKSAKIIELDAPSSGIASTDANIPLSRNIPAVAFGCYYGTGAHTKSETIYVNSLIKGIPYANLVIIKTMEWITLV